MLVGGFYRAIPSNKLSVDVLAEYIRGESG